MDVSTILNWLLVAAFIAVGIALVVFIVQLTKTMKSVKSTVDNLNVNLEPTLKNVATVTTDIQPAVRELDPLLERANLTVDALNLELMRVDKLLSDLGDVTATASNAAGAADTVMAAPANLVSNVTSKLSSRLGGKKASAASAELAAAAARAQKLAAAAEEEPAPPADEPDEAAEPAPAADGAAPAADEPAEQPAA